MRTKAVFFHYRYTAYKINACTHDKKNGHSKHMICFVTSILSTQRSDIYYVSYATTVRSNTQRLSSLPLSRTDTHGGAISSPRTLANLLFTYAHRRSFYSCDSTTHY